MGGIDQQLWRRQINDYLQTLDAVREYTESVLTVELPGIVEFQNRLHNGVYISLLSMALAPNEVFGNMEVYDCDQHIYDSHGIQYRHIDNILIFLKYLNYVALPNVFLPDVVDIFEKKNIPKLVYCMCALMNHLNNTVVFSKTQVFPDDVITSMANQLEGHDLNSLTKLTLNRAKKKEPTPINETVNIVQRLEEVLLKKDFDLFCKIMHDERELFNCRIYAEANRLYYEELLFTRLQRKGALALKEIKSIIKKQSKIFLVTVYTCESNINGLMSILSTDKDIHPFVNHKNIELYFEAFKSVLDTKLNNNIFNYNLTKADIVDIICEINEERNSVTIKIAAAVKIQIWWKAILRQRITNKQNAQTVLEKIAKLQAICRGVLVRRSLEELKIKPSFLVIKKYSWLLQYSLKSYEQELKLQLLKSELVQKIQHGKSLRTTLEEKDIQIGLLIQNRITIQEICNVQKKKKVHPDLFINEKGLKALDGPNQKRLEAFQNLFYLLQTTSYFSVLLNNISCNEKQLQDIILLLFNYGSTKREEYLLLKMFESAIRTEVFNKYYNIDDLIVLNSAVIKTVTSYAKQGIKIKVLKEILENVVGNVLLEEEEILLYPIEIYRQLEHRIKKTKNSPVPSNNEEALKLDVVKKQLEINIFKIQTHIKAFINRLLETIRILPYGIKYLYSVLSVCLGERFNVPMRTILKILGHSLFYHYLNPVIIFPELHGIIELCIDKPVLSKQRRNLATIAKMLQNIALNKGFSEETKYLMPLNEFMMGMNGLLSKYVGELLKCNDLEREYNVSQYSEAILVGQLQVTVTLEIIAKIHCVLLHYQSLFPSSDFDTINKLIDEIGPYSTAVELLKNNLFANLGVKHVDHQFRISCVGKNQNLCKNAELQKVFVSTKEFCVFLLPFLEGRTLPQSLLLEPTREQSNNFQKNIEFLSTYEQQNIMTGTSLSQAKRRLKNMLGKLENQGYVSRDDGFQTILTAISKDIFNKNHFQRVQEKEMKDVTKVTAVIEQQNSKLEEQLKVYEEYLESCLRNQVVSHQVLHGRPGKILCTLKSKKGIKYTAQNLIDKRVLISVADIPPTYLNSIIIEISPEEGEGYFLVTGKFKTLHMEKLSIDIRHLLHLKYEGINELDIFQNVKINVQGLIFLINRKFYGNNENSFKFL